MLRLIYVKHVFLFILLDLAYILPSFIVNRWYHIAFSLHFDCRIPIIGGKDLDLHRLFVEVTSRGGIERAN